MTDLESELLAALENMLSLVDSAVAVGLLKPSKTPTIRTLQIEAAAVIAKATAIKARQKTAERETKP